MSDPTPTPPVLSREEVEQEIEAVKDHPALTITVGPKWVYSVLQSHEALRAEVERLTVRLRDEEGVSKGLRSEFESRLWKLDELEDEVERLRQASDKTDSVVCQTMGKAMGYPWYKDDPANFPGATEADGVCVGDHVAESIAAEAARYIERLRAERDELRTPRHGSCEACGFPNRPDGTCTRSGCCNEE